MEEYLRCLLGDKPYCKSYTLYDGRLKFGFKSIDGNQVSEMNRLLFGLDPAGVEVQDLSIKIKALYFLSEMDCNGKAQAFEAPVLKSPADIGPEFDKRFGHMSELMLRLLTQAMVMFLDLQAVLVSAGFDSNFWKGAGLRSR